MRTVAQLTNRPDKPKRSTALHGHGKGPLVFQNVCLNLVGSTTYPPVRMLRSDGPHGDDLASLTRTSMKLSAARDCSSVGPDSISIDGTGCVVGPDAMLMLNDVVPSAAVVGSRGVLTGELGKS